MEYINCGWCEEPFLKKNRLHKFCSSRCKKKSWRANNGKSEFPAFLNPVIRNIRVEKPLIKESSIPNKTSTSEIAKIPIPEAHQELYKEQTEEPKPGKYQDPDKKDKFDLIIDKLIEKERDKMLSSGIYTNKRIEQILYDDIVKHRGKVEKAVRKLNNALEKKKKEYLGEYKVIRKSKKEINSIISKKRKEKEAEFKMLIKKKYFDMLDGNLGLMY